MNLTPRLKIIGHDLAAIIGAWLLALLARFNFSIPPEEFVNATLMALPVVILIQSAISWRFGLYRGLWRFASLRDLWNIIRAAVLGAVTSGIVLFFLTRLESIPRSVIILYPFFLVFLLGGARLLYRVWKDHTLSLNSLHDGPRVIVVGGGSGGEMVVRDMLHDRSFVPVGIVDDDPSLKRSRIHSVPVLGTIEELAEIVQRREVDTVVIAIPSATNSQMRRIVAQCEATKKPFRTLPQLHDMISGRAGVQSLREVSIDDLLGRDKVELEWSLIQAAVAGKTVLISGGGGSIGSELCRQIASLGVHRLIVFERSEFNLYAIEHELRQSFPHLKLHLVLGDICDRPAVTHVFERFRPSLVLHAAAFKHVSVLQAQAREAVRNNVLGTREMIDAAHAFGCEAFVLISTDKAVRPSSVMGATKRVAELMCEVRNRDSTTRLITVRFGNVLGSAGSVVPRFREQIAGGGPVTVTHPEARRYFMTIPEACQLILLAGASGVGGEIFVLDMGEPINITYLAEQMIRLSGREPGEDIAIVYTGLRAGEKLNEELFHEDERLAPTGHEKLLLAQHVEVNPQDLEALVNAMSDASDAFDQGLLEDLLREAVPEFGRMQASADTDENVVVFPRSVS